MPDSKETKSLNKSLKSKKRPAPSKRRPTEAELEKKDGKSNPKAKVTTQATYETGGGKKDPGL